jgi:glycosyltransferase involved in cell wall biosynthesis
VILETKRTAVFNPAVWLMMAAERMAYRSCDAAVAVNEEVRTTMERRGLAPGKFHVVQNGVVLDAKEEKEELSPTIQKRLPQDDAFCVGYAGSLSRVYGLEYLIEAARLLRHKQINFVLAGTGGDERMLREKSAELSNVFYVGWVPKQELNSFLRHMDIAYAGLLNLPSLAIGSNSTKLFEYMKAELPVVHALGAKVSVIQQSGCGFHVSPEDAGVIAEAVLRMRNLSAAKRRLRGKLGLEYIEKHHSYDVLGRKWMNLLKS